MKYDQYGQTYTTSNELCDLLYKNPALDISLFQVEDSIEYNRSVAELYAELDLLDSYHTINQTVEEFDQTLQKNWHMPVEYHDMDIAEYVVAMCDTAEKLQRVGHELLLYQERGLFDLLRYLKYLVDVMRGNHVIWGVGRGSSVASYVLYLLGVHRIDSMYYDLDVGEFLR